MKTFKTRTQATGGNIHAPRTVKWMEMWTEDIKIAIDGSNRNQTLQIRVEANGVIYELTDSLLEMILGQVSEEYSKEFLTFNVFDK